MASIIYNSAVRDAAIGDIAYDSDTFWVMLVTNAYVANKDTHTKRSDITNEVAGAGYSAGGKVVVATPALDTSNDREDITFSTVIWTAASVTARAAVIYKRRGGASSADELVAYVDFGADITSTAGDFTIVFSSPLRYQN